MLIASLNNAHVVGIRNMPQQTNVLHRQPPVTNVNEKDITVPYVFQKQWSKLVTLDDVYLDTVTLKQNTAWHTTLLLEQTKVCFKMDTAAEVSTSACKQSSFGPWLTRVTSIGPVSRHIDRKYEIVQAYRICNKGSGQLPPGTAGHHSTPPVAKS